MNKQVAAVVVTYEPDSGWPLRLQAILAVCTRCVVVDNSISEEARARVASTVASCPGAELIANPDNPGIGRALNQGFAVLFSANYAWALAFDQDSHPAPNLATTLLITANTKPPAPDNRRVAVVGSNWQDAGQPDHSSKHLVQVTPFRWFFRRIPACVDLPDVLCVITSGSLFSLPAWAAIGGFREDLFLDLVDTDFCLRARQYGWRIAVSAHAKLRHHRGSKQAVKLFGCTFYPAFTPPSRLHCLSRNRIILIKKHGYREPAWALYELVYALKLLCDILFLEDQKATKLRACAVGTLRALPP